LKRIVVLLVAVIAFALAAATAQAKQVESKKVAKSPDEVAAYWTPERMRDARPAPAAKPGGGGGGGKPSKAGSATEVPGDYQSYPTSTNGKVFFTENGVNYVCSGTALTSGNERVVWTAGHCVNEGPGDFVDNWAFVPAYRDGSRPYGTWAATSLYTSTEWRTDGDFSYDVGAARVALAGSTATLTDTVGGRPIAFNYTPSQLTYSAYGYPQASPFNGQRLWVCANAPLYLRDNSASPATMGIQCNLTGGSSGGSWIARVNGVDSVVSVNSYGYSNLRNVMFGPYQTSVAQGVYDGAQSG
jgi:V8-like Glu-specific endopeptidase